MSQHTLHFSKLFGFPIVAEPFKTVFEYVANHQGRTLIIFTPNPEQIVLASENSQFREYLSQADLLLPDGAGLVLASRLLAASARAIPIPERITGIDLVAALLEKAVTEKKKVLVVGGRGYGKNQVAGQVIPENTSKLNVLSEFLPEMAVNDPEWYWLEGYNDVENPTKLEEKQVSQVIKKLKPDYVFVALGAPYQERWLLEHRTLLEETHAAVGIAVGGTFDVLTGQLERAPEWMQRSHLEWLYRLKQEPWRWRRQTKLLLFVKEAVQELLN